VAMKKFKIEKEFKEGDYLYLNLLYYWLRGYISAKGEDSRDSILLRKAIVRLGDISNRIYDGVHKK